MKKLILSPVGMSLFLNILNNDERREGWQDQLNRIANKADLDGDDLKKVLELKDRVINKLESSKPDKCRNISAELNGIFGLYSEIEQGKADHHLLIGTDTFVGRQAVEVIEAFLQEKGFSTDSIIPKKLSADSSDDFSDGMKDLLNECEKRIPDFRKSGYEVIFNLTAAFKVLQSYLNIVGMFYADRLVYIFQGSNQLLSIPRLPIKTDTEQIAGHANELAYLAAGGSLKPEKLIGIPEALLRRKADNTYELSEWGVLIWNTIKNEILSEKLLDFPYIEYDKQFMKEFNLSKDIPLKIDLQETLAVISVILTIESGDITELKKDGGLQYSNYDASVKTLFLTRIPFANP
ncbi:MAG: putative CRISPR-associated protein [bacterium]